MGRELLKEYIKKAIREKLAHMESIEANREKSVYMIYKFPGLKNALENLMSPAFARFISSIEIIAPKPTTFRIIMSNDMDFNLAYVGKKTFIAKINGKKYNLNDLGQTERASQAIANTLELNYNTETLKDDPNNPNSVASDLNAGEFDGGGGSGGPGNFPGAPEPGPETAPGLGDEPLGPPEGEPGLEEPEDNDMAPGIDNSVNPPEEEER